MTDIGAIKAVLALPLVLLIIGFLVISIRQKGPREYPVWTSADLKIMRTCRAIMWSSVAIAWAVVMATVAHQPALIYHLTLADIILMPLMMTVIASIMSSWSNPGLKNLYRSAGFRWFMIGHTFAIVFLLGVSLLASFGKWSAHL